MSAPYPWLDNIWRHLWQLQHNQRLPHALLLRGSADIGKYSLAERFAAGLLCDRSGPDAPCGACPACQLIASDSHPDLLKLSPEEGSTTIKVDQVRRILPFSAQTAQYNGFKIIILRPAELMTEAAANSLLKTLEEPSRDTLLILVSNRSGALPITVRSRCQQLHCRVDVNVVQSWADAAQINVVLPHAPLRFLHEAADAQSWQMHMAELDDILAGADVLPFAAKWARADSTRLAALLYHWCWTKVQATSGTMRQEAVIVKPLLQLEEALRDLLRQGLVGLSAQALAESLLVRLQIQVLRGRKIVGTKAAVS